MNNANSQESIFINPDGSNQELISELFSRVTKQIISHLSAAGQKRSFPNTAQIFNEEMSLHFDHPRSLDEIESAIDRTLALSLNPSNPRYMGHMDSLPTTASVLGGLITSALNNNLLSVELAPYFSFLETQITKFFSNEFGLPQTAQGVLLSGGTLCNLQALTVARNQTLSCAEDGLMGYGRAVVFCSEAAHTSVEKACMILGLGTKACRRIPVDARQKIRVSVLKEEIDRSKKQNEVPIAIIATAGTTVAGAIDPLGEIGALAKRENIWFHVDAAYGGSFILSSKRKSLLKGIESADSITFNPQKWMYVTKICTMILFRNFNEAKKSFHIDLPYMQTNDALINYGAHTVQGTRAPDILKLWLSLLHIGKSGYEKIFEKNFNFIHILKDELQNIKNIQFLCEPETNILCFRVEEDKSSAEETDQLMVHIFEQLRQKGDTFFSLPTYQGKRWLRIVLLNPFFQDQDVRRVKSDLLVGIDTAMSGRP